MDVSVWSNRTGFEFIVNAQEKHLKGSAIFSTLFSNFWMVNKQPSTLRDPWPTGPLSAHRMGPNPNYVCNVVKKGPLDAEGMPSYIVAALETDPQHGKMFGFMNGTISLEIYARDIAHYHERFAAEIQAFLMEKIGLEYDIIRPVDLLHDGCAYTPHAAD